MTLSTGSKLGSYEVVLQIGAVGLGEVYRAYHGLVAHDHTHPPAGEVAAI